VKSIKPRLQNLGTQLVLSFMIISLIVFTASSLVLYSYMMNLFKKQNERLLEQQFQQFDHNIHSLVSEVDRLTNLFKLDPNLQQLLADPEGMSELDYVTSKNNLHALIQTYLDNYTYIRSIYFFSERTGAIGGTGDTTLVHSDQEWNKLFVQSDAYRETMRSFPALTLQGGMGRSFYNPYLTGDLDGPLFSMMRGVRAITRPQTSGVLIFTVDERYLTSIYASSGDKDSGMFIMDGRGRILSAGDSRRVGSLSPFLPKEGVRYGSQDGTVSDERIQFVYYKLQDRDWYLVKEVPISQYSRQISVFQRLLVSVFLISVLIMFVLSYFWLRRIIKPLHRLTLLMKDVSSGELGGTLKEVPNNEIGTVIRRFNEMSLSIVSLIAKNNEIQEQKRLSELEAMQYQINPHFLYNTLNMIRWMASLAKADNIVVSIVALGNILRAAFTNKSTMCTLRDEFSYLENYVKIINLRFNNGVVFEVAEAEAEPYLDYRVPRFILQPLVENSIASGSLSEEHTVHIRISVEAEESDLLIRVSDTGVGLESARLEELNAKLTEGLDTPQLGSGSGIGLRNVNRRIRLSFGERYGLRFVPRDVGAEVVVRLPADPGP